MMTPIDRNPDEETLEVPLAKARGRRFPASLHRVQRRPLGLDPQIALGVLLALSVAATLALLVSAAWPAGVLLLVLSTALAGFFSVSVRSDPDTRLARAAMTLLDRTVSLGRLVTAAVLASSRGTASLARLTLKRLRLRRDLRRALVPLGEAVHRGQEQRAEILKSRTARLEHELLRTERERAAVVEAVRAEVERERAGIEATTALPVVADPDQAEAAPGDGASPGRERM